MNATATIRALRLSVKDNVATAIADIASGTDVEVHTDRDVVIVRAVESVPFGFKLAVVDIAKNTPIRKYGEEIGIASLDIRKGEKVHVHNLAGARGRGDLSR